MACKVLLKDKDTGLTHIESRTWSVPLADIGEKVGYLPAGFPKNSKAFLEAIVVKITMEQMQDKDKNIVEAISYMLDNGVVLTEDEVEYFVPWEE